MSRPAFPSRLAKIVFDRWNHLVAGDYVVPACPPLPRLKELLEIAYLAGNAPEEGRYPHFNIVAVPASSPAEREDIGQGWRFDTTRSLTVAELRRLAPAVDIKKSGIWAAWGSEGWRLVGLVDLGTSWHRARMGLEYRYRHPSCLIIQVDRPSRMRVYQGGYHVATLADGKIEAHRSVPFHLFLHNPANAALKILEPEFIRPTKEEPREFINFEFLALWNTYAAIANSVSLEGHGGAVVIAPIKTSSALRTIKMKYAQNSTVLRSAFINFMNARHVIGDLIARIENKEAIPDEKYSDAEIKIRDAYAELVEATRFVARLSACDGSIVISHDLRLFGFGGEIRAEMRKRARVVEVVEEMGRRYRPLDIEQFGLRHRSAIKLVSRNPGYTVLVISQDGPITAVWSEKNKVLVKKGLTLVNMNMPWG